MTDVRRWQLAFGAGLIAVAACTPADGGTAGERPEAADSGARVINVEVTPVGRSAFTDYIRITGEVEAIRDVTIAAEEGGVVERFLVSKGTRVQAGQPLAELDAAVLRTQVEEARAMARLAREQYERQRVLWEEERIGTEIAYLQAKYQAEGAAARLATLEARLERTVIRAPVAGVFDAKYLEAGEMAPPGAPVARVVALDQVKVTAGVPERYAPVVRRGTTARVTFDVLPSREFEGQIGFVGSSVDPRNRTFLIEVVLRNPGGAIKPRMVANVQVVRTELRDAIVVPQDAVLRTSGGYEVFVAAVQQDGKSVAEARPVQLGPAYANRVVVESGLEVGDRLITVGQQLVSGGSPVRIVGPRRPSDSLPR